MTCHRDIRWSVPMVVVLTTILMLPSGARGFDDTERGGAASLAAAAVDIALTDTVPVMATLGPDEEAAGSLRLRNDGSVRVVYRLHAVRTGDDAALCNTLRLRVRSGTTILYDGALTHVDHGADLDAGAAVTLDLTVAMPTDVSAAAAGRTCMFRVDAVATAGFGDTETMGGNTVTSRDTVPPNVPTMRGWNVGGASATSAEMPVDKTCGAWTNDGRIAPVWSDESGSGAIAYEWELTDTTGTTDTAIVTSAAPDFIATGGAEGVWSVRVRSRDVAGNWSSWSASCAVNTDYTPPEPTTMFDPIAMNPATRGGMNGIAFSVDTDEVSVARGYYDMTPADPEDPTTYAYQTAQNPADGPTSTHHEVFYPFPLPGDWWFYVTLTDRAGNVLSSGGMIFNIPTLPAADAIVLNEIMANPVGNDAAAKPGGEWVELYNNGAIPIDVRNWHIEDAVGARWTVTVANGDNDGDPTDAGETVVPAGGYLVVYRNGASMTVNNDGEDLFLLDAGGNLRDDHTFTVAGFGEGKSVARFPDGLGVWIDPDGTPGDENRLPTHERDRLRRETFATCFDRGMRLRRDDAGTICDPVFLAYIGMIADEKSDVLARPELLVTPELPPVAPSDVPSDAVPATMTDTAKTEEIVTDVPTAPADGPAAGPDPAAAVDAPQDGGGDGAGAAVPEDDTAPAHPPTNGPMEGPVETPVETSEDGIAQGPEESPVAVEEAASEEGVVEEQKENSEGENAVEEETEEKTEEKIEEKDEGTESMDTKDEEKDTEKEDSEEEEEVGEPNAAAGA